MSRHLSRRGFGTASTCRAARLVDAEALEQRRTRVSAPPAATAHPGGGQTLAGRALHQQR